MAPNFLSKFVKSNDRHERERSRASSISTTPSSRNPSINITVPTIAHPVTTPTHKSLHDDHNSDTSSINPNVTVIPPSPIPSELTLSNQSHIPARNGAPATDVPQGDSEVNSVRRTHSLSLGHQPKSSPTLNDEDEDPSTPTPGRPNMTDRQSTIRPLSHSSSTGDLREALSNGNGSKSPSEKPSSRQSRSHTVVSNGSPSSNSTPSSPNTLSKKSSRSRLAAKLGLETAPSVPSLPVPSRHERSATSPPDTPPVRIDPPHPERMVESPTHITSPQSLIDFMPPKPPSLSASATMPNVFPSSSLLGLPDSSDTASVYSVGGTAKKRRPWRRSSKESTPSVMSPNTPSSPGSSRSPKRKPSGLAGAIAMSSMAMINPTMTVPTISPTESGSSATQGRHKRSGSVTASIRSSSHHRRRPSIDNHPKTPPSRGNRSRRTSVSGYAPSELSDRDSFHSGMVGSGSSGESSEDEDLDDLDLDADDIPVTGFAVASNMRNQEFHKMFSAIPEGDYLIEDYGCALQREILIQGRLYISENHVCFHANIFGWITDLVIPMYDVITLDKRMTAFVIPNAISLTTRTAKYTFTSFLSRDTTFDVMYNVWRLARPEDESLSSLGASQLSPSMASVVSGTLSTIPAAVNGNSKAAGKATKKAPVNKVTQCGCAKGSIPAHYSEVASESIFPGTPEKIYNLMFTSGFIKDFMRVNQKLIDIQISDWMPLPDNATLLTRNMSYIKPLSGPVGPRQTKCELRDELAHSDFDDYVTMLTTTRTPDVPSGGVFSVKTKTCITWASSITTRVIVTTQVEWTGRSFIRGIIEKSCIDGQKGYQADLDKAMREYIHQHQSEFVPEGVDVAEVEEEAEVQAAAEAVPRTPTQESQTLTGEAARIAREKQRNQRGIQWAYDTFEGAFDVAKRSADGAFELLADAWDQSSSTSILYTVIVVLMISNIWTLTMMGKREDVGRRQEQKRSLEREKWVQGVVSGLWDELAASRVALGSATMSATQATPTTAADWKDQVGGLNDALDAIDARVKTLRESIKDLADMESLE